MGKSDVSFKLNQDSLKIVEQEAEKRGLSKGQYARMILLASLEAKKTEN